MGKTLHRLNVIDRDGKKTSIDIEEGATIRDTIEEKISPENYGLCGGNCNCGTCHIYIDPNDFKKLKKSCSEILKLSDIQFFQPYFSLYFHIHNTKNSHQLIDLNRRFIVKEILESNIIKYYSSNKFINSAIYDKKKKSCFY